jgi:predicted transcriptional regulator
MGTSSKLPQLLFELGSTERYETVRLLTLGEMRVSEIASKLGLSRSDISRHLARLQKVGLIEKSPNGFKATVYGQLALEQCKAIDFLLRNHEYFETHMWEVVPKTLLYRINALEEGQLYEGVAHTLRTVEKAISAANEYLDVVLSEVPRPLIPPVLDRLAKGVPARFVLTQNAVDHVKDFFGENPQYDLNLLKRAKIKVVDSLFACTAINEMIAGTNLINRAKPHEHFSTHFIGTSPSFRAWCREVFDLHDARSKVI